MGSPTQTQIQNITDRLAALIKLNLDGFSDELTGATNLSLWHQVDAVGDADFEAWMMTYALAADRQSLPENYKTALPTILGRDGYRNFAQQLQAHVQRSAGGSFANLRAYLTDRSATVHPLFAELHRSIFGEDAFTLSSDVTTVFSPNYATRAPERFYVGADGSLAADTTDAGDADTADVDLFASDDDLVYIGSRYQFTQAIFGLSTAANTDIGLEAQYFNGNSWVSLTVTDNSVGLTKNDTLKWTAPSDWARTYLDAGGTAFPSEDTPLYYVRLKRTTNTVATPPVATCVRIVPAAVLNASGAHLGVDQPPLAIVRITGASTIVVESIAEVAYARWAEPGIRFRALTPGLGTPTITVAYTDQAGNTGNTQAQSALSSPAALDAVSITLSGADTGVRAIATTGWVVSGGAQGVLAVEVAESRTPAL